MARNQTRARQAHRQCNSRCNTWSSCNPTCRYVTQHTRELVLHLTRVGVVQDPGSIASVGPHDVTIAGEPMYHSEKQGTNQFIDIGDHYYQEATKSSSGTNSLSRACSEPSTPQGSNLTTTMSRVFRNPRQLTRERQPTPASAILYKCILCSTSFNSRKTCRQHMKGQHVDKKYHKCSGCGYVSLTRGEAKSHCSNSPSCRGLNPIEVWLEQESYTCEQTGRHFDGPEAGKRYTNYLVDCSSLVGDSKDPSHSTEALVPNYTEAQSSNTPTGPHGEYASRVFDSDLTFSGHFIDQESDAHAAHHQWTVTGDSPSLADEHVYGAPLSSHLHRPVFGPFFQHDDKVEGQEKDQSTPRAPVTSEIDSTSVSFPWLSQDSSSSWVLREGSEMGSKEDVWSVQ